ncbi:MAG: hypothetical protein Q7V63_06945 [Gammaproteobacteria bacterium]|nr:hypothetical protein [Gammaproteobacteria bacterium]
MKLTIPMPLRKYCEEKDVIYLNVHSINQIGKAVEIAYQKLYKVLFVSNTQLNGFANIFLNGILVSDRLNETIVVKDDDTAECIVSIAGG